jgi:FKBP-type peptidyl-prolyl cis-trans isomerase
MSREQIIQGVAVAVGIAVVLLFFIFNPFMAQTSSMETNDQSAALGGDVQNTPAAAPLQQTNPSQLVAQDEKIGTGEVAQAGMLVTVHYTGKFQDGGVFDSSVGKQPFQFVLGGGQVIAGWDQGLQGMKVGGKRLLIIPPSLGYGAQQVGPIPPNSTLVFEVDLLKVEPLPAAAH